MERVVVPCLECEDQGRKLWAEGGEASQLPAKAAVGSGAASPGQERL